MWYNTTKVLIIGISIFLIMDFLKKSKFAYFIWVFLGAATLLMLVKAKAEFKGYNRAFPPNIISVSGEGKVFIKPDVGTVTVSVIKNNKDFLLAQRQATEAVNALTIFLKEKGVVEKDIKTIRYNAGPRYNYQGGTERFRDYEVRQELDIKIRDVARAGEVLAGATFAGADKISSLGFAVDDPDAAKAEARALAIKEAKEKAATLSKNLGVRLTKLSSYYENDGGYPGPIFYGQDFAVGKGGDAMVPPAVPVGENEVRIQVNLSYEIR